MSEKMARFLYKPHLVIACLLEGVLLLYTVTGSGGRHAPT